MSNSAKFVFLALLASFLQVFTALPTAEAIDPGSWRAGNIIDDPTYSDKGSMSVADIQSFLNSKVPTCDTWGTKPSGYGGTRAQYGASRGNPVPFTCLKDYREVPKTTPGGGIPANNYGNVNGSNPAGSRSAAEIIWQAAQDFNISPKVLLVTLQKESGLITDDWTFKSQLVYAMGAHCPDTGPGGSANCDANYAGFSLQIRESADLMRYYLDNMQQSWWSNKRPYQNNFIKYDVEASCGGSNIYMENKATTALYVYTPYQPSQAALNAGYGSAEPCGAYGNRNFWLYFNDWFGSTQSPSVFRVEGSSAVYVNAGGYKVSIPSMFTLQDFGYDPAAIQVISQSKSNQIPTPPASSGVSSSLGHVIKSTSDSDADGGAAYFVSVGNRYPITSMDQFNNFGFNVSSIIYLPMSYIQTLRSGPGLYDFLRTPDGSIFNVNSAQKRLLFSNETHLTANPSGNVTTLSTGAASLISTGNPYNDSKAVFIKKTSSDAVFAYNNDSYYSVSAESYECWGVNTLSDRPLRILNPDYLPASLTASDQIGCIYNHPQGNLQVLDKTKRIAIPAEYGISVSFPSIPSNLQNLYGNTPLSGTSLRRAVKSTNSNTVWYLEAGKKRPIPSMSNFNLLGGVSQLDILDSSSLNSIPEGSIKLGNGQAVKSPDSPAVFIINGLQRYSAKSAEQFIGLNQKWENVETYDQSSLDALYGVSSTSIKPYLYVNNLNKTYLMDANGCYSITPEKLQSYGQDEETIKSSQPYSSSIAPYTQFENCRAGSSYIKSDSNGTVYRLENGTKHPISSWNKLVTLNGGTAPNISTLTTSFVAEFPTGSTY